MLDIRSFYHGNKAFKREIYANIFSSNMSKDTKKRKLTTKFTKE